jgi:hypothetical protein
MNSPITTVPSRARLLVGGFVFVAGFAVPALIPLVTGSNLTATWKTFLSGFLAIGIPEIFMLFAAGILGKQGFAYLKSKLWRLIEPPETVGRLRYRIGLLMFLAPIVFIWLHPYLEQARPELADARFGLGLASTGLLTASLFVLGGEFWDKLRGLFLHHANVIPPVEPAASTPPAAPAETSPPMPRLLLGGLFIALSLLLPLFIPLLAYLPVSEEMRYVTGGLMVFGIPQALMLLAVSVLGEPGFVYLKQRFGGLLKTLLASEISQSRHRLGVFLLVGPVLIGLAWPYLSRVFDTLVTYKLEIAIAGDAILIAAVFILGGQFWEKLISLFRHRSRIVLTPAGKHTHRD